MQTRFIRYIKVLSISLCIGLVLTGMINALVDPYNELGWNWIGVYGNDDRQRIKAIDTYPHDALLTGSSRTLHINPDDLCGYKFYNASFSSALPEEIYYYLKKYLKDEKMVVIGLDFYMFNDTSYPLLNIDKWPDRYWPTQEYLFGWNVLMDSLKAVYIREYLRQGRPSNGYVPIQDDPTPDMKTYQFWINFFINHVYKDYHLNEERFQYMQKLKQLLDDRHEKYIIFINPMQEDHWKVLHLTGNYEAFWKWVIRLKGIFPDIKYFPEGQYSQRELYLKSDPSHYLPFVGAMIVNGLTGCGP